MRRSRAVALQLFRTKSPDHLIAEAEAPDRQMKRTLGPLTLTCIGIGAVIGAGIFSLTGTAAAGQTFASGLETPVINFIQAWFSGTGAVLGRAGAGPAIAVSFIVAGIACAFAAFCYAELASMIPVSGSAYTYSYATMGELVAWIIGWDLILEYAVGSATVAHGWSAHFQEFIPLFGLDKYLPYVLSKGPFDYCVSVGKDCPHTGFVATGAYFDLPAILITADRSPAVREEARARDTQVLNKPLKPAALRALLAKWGMHRMAAAE